MLDMLLDYIRTEAAHAKAQIARLTGHGLPVSSDRRRAVTLGAGRGNA